MSTDIDFKEIIERNEAKKKEKFKPFNQLTGLNCTGDRFYLHIADAPSSKDFSYKDLYLPKEMGSLKIVQDLKKLGSIQALYEYNGETLTNTSYQQLWVNFCDLRQQFDFEFFAATLATINDKLTSTRVNFKLNSGQRKLLTELEHLRTLGVPIRIILLKCRQWGGSTLIQIYMSWIQLFIKKNWNSVICAHVKDASITIRSMLDSLINSMPRTGGVKFSIKNFAGTQNIKHIPQRGCRITVGTAIEPDSVRSQDAKMAHLSEVAFYPDTEMQSTNDLIKSIVGSVPRVPSSFIAYESTANGVGDWFYEEYQKATKKESAFYAVFVAWFEIEIYSHDFTNNEYFTDKGRLAEGTIEDFVKTLDTYELMLFNTYEKCTLENINWYRVKKSEFKSHSDMKQEYPSDEVEAFQGSGSPVFHAEHVERLRREYCLDPIAVGTIVGDGDISTARLNPDETTKIFDNIRFVNDTSLLDLAGTSNELVLDNKFDCKIRIWDFPSDSDVLNRYVVSVDTGGRSKKADWSVIKVFDRLFMTSGGVPEVVAMWRGHLDHDMLVWTAAQIATYYHNALLVFESNTHETEYRTTDGDHTEFIFNTLSKYYDNLYARETPDTDVKDKAPIKYGFHTNTATKTAIIDLYTVLLREIGYYERCQITLNEARTYEKTKKGKYEAKQGKHDDALMTTMIGLWVCYNTDMPSIKPENNIKRNRTIINESTI